jgi:hypothetical protein
MDLGEAAIRSVDWARFRTSEGKATQFGDVLVQLLRGRDAAEAEEVWRRIENVVFSQDMIFSAAEPTIDAMLAALVQDRPVHVKASVIDLLFHLLHGGSDEDPDLSRRCRERALRGTWLLVREAATGPEWVRDPVLEILDLVDHRQAEALRAWLVS